MAHEFFLDGVRQVYRVAGQGPLCVAHAGGPGLDASYLRAPALEQRFTVVYPEPVGTGASGAPADGYPIATYVRFLAALVAHLGDGPVHLLGHSHGGFVAQTYALAHPERVAGLILYSTSPEAGPEFWAEASAGLAAYPARHPDVPEAADVPEAFRRALQATDDDTLSASFRAALPVYFADFWSRRAEFASWQASVRMAAGPATSQDPVPFDVRDRLGEITAPTVVITGRHDFMCGPARATRLSDGIPGARLRILEHSGHFGHVEQPTAFAAAAVEVLEPPA
jgi:pimeloyl-ACP methyl ester carboxylesterase